MSYKVSATNLILLPIGLGIFSIVIAVIGILLLGIKADKNIGEEH